MYPYFHIVIPSYTLMALIGGFFVLCFCFFRIDKYGIVFSDFLKVFLICVVAVFLGSKLLYAITRIPWLIDNFTFGNLLLLIPQSGFVFYGGLFGVIFAILFITRRDNNKRDKLFKLIVPAMPLFHAFGRIGCFLAGCCYGKKLENHFTLGSLEFAYIPIQLIEAIAALVIFVLLIIVEKKMKDTNILKIYLCSYAVVRFVDEFFRGDEIRGIFGPFSTSQWISLIIIIVYEGKMIKKKVELKKSTQNVAQDHHV